MNTKIYLQDQRVHETEELEGDHLWLLEQNGDSQVHKRLREVDHILSEEVSKNKTKYNKTRNTVCTKNIAAHSSHPSVTLQKKSGDPGLRLTLG